MRLGFVSAILPDLPLAEVLAFAAETGYDCVEVMCWPPSVAERRYAGVTHLDVSEFTTEHVRHVNDLVAKTGVLISGLGYYPNPLSPDEEEAKQVTLHLEKVINVGAMLGLANVNTFIGRDYTRSVDDNWPRCLATWQPIARLAESLNIKIGIENCPMLFSADEWPGGKNLAVGPAVWRKLFTDLGSPNIGLNYDPSHLVWQQMDYVKPIREFADRIFHVHAKDCRIDRDQLDDVGILAYPSAYHTPKLPGLGDVNWGKFFSALTDAGYAGAVCVEVEDRAYEGSLDRRKDSLRQSATYLRNFIPKAVR